MAQYVWNIPWEIKAFNGREKGLLRYVMKDMLPEEIVDRKEKSLPKNLESNISKKSKRYAYKNYGKQISSINNLLNEPYIFRYFKNRW